MTVLGTCLVNNEFSLVILHLQGSTEAHQRVLQPVL